MRPFRGNLEAEEGLRDVITCEEGDRRDGEDVVAKANSIIRVGYLYCW